MNRPFFTLTLFLLIFVFVGPVLADEYQEAYEQTQVEYQAAVDTVSQTKEKVDDLKEKLEKVEAFVKANPKLVKDSKKVLKKLKETKKGLAKYSGHLGKFGDYAGKVTDAFATVNELAEIRSAAKSHKGGKLAENMHYIGTVMEKFGDKVPILGPAVQAYGQMTTGLLTATDKVATKINDTRNAGMIGAGTFGGMDNPKYQKLVEQYGRDFADGDTFAPSHSNFIYRSINDPNEPALIWDDKSGEWYKAEGKVEKIYRDNLLAGKRRDPWQLKVLADNRDKADERRDQAEKIYDHLKRTWNLPYDMTDKEEFIAGYTYNNDKNKAVKDHLAGLQEKFAAQEDKRGQKGLEKLIDKTGVKLPEKKTVDSDKPEAKNGADSKGEDKPAAKDTDKKANDGNKGDDDKGDDKAGDSDKSSDRPEDQPEKTKARDKKDDAKDAEKKPEGGDRDDKTRSGDDEDGDDVESKDDEAADAGDDKVDDNIASGLGVAPSAQTGTVCGKLFGFMEEAKTYQGTGAASDDAFSKADRLNSRGTRRSGPEAQGMSVSGAPAPAAASSGHQCDHDG